MNIDEKLKSLTLEDKAKLFTGGDFWHTAKIENTPQIMVSDGPHGLRKQNQTGDHLGLGDSIKAICYPTASALANSFNTKLYGEVGYQIGLEAKKEELDIVLGPGVNIKRNPLCGRNFEYISEDPHLSGTLGAHFVKGLQDTGIGTCLKHYALNSRENQRYTSDSIVDERTLREIYLKSFETIIKYANPTSIMTSYNLIDNTYASENSNLLNTIGREKLGFKGFYMSDWGAVNDARESVKNGLNLEMPGNKNTPALIIKAIKENKLTEEQLDNAIKPLLSFLYRDKNLTKDEWNIDKALDTALNAALESMVLVKNEKVLPLKKEIKYGFIGKLFKEPKIQGQGSSQINSIIDENVLQYLTDYNYEYLEGLDEYGAIIPNQKDKLFKMARDCQQLVVYIGFPKNAESEGFDRSSMSLAKGTIDLIDMLHEINANIICIFSGGSPVEIPFISKIKGLLLTYLTGCKQAKALSLILSGEVSPSGRLAETYFKSYDNVPNKDIYQESTVYSLYSERQYFGYRFTETQNIQPLFDFGYGLQYGKVSYSDIKIQSKFVSIKDKNEPFEFKINLKLKNDSKYTLKEVVQVYITKLNSKIARAKELKFFIKEEIEPKQTKDVEITLDPESFKFFNVLSKDWDIESGEYKIDISKSASSCLEDFIVNIDLENKEPIQEEKSISEFDSFNDYVKYNNDELKKKIVPSKKKPFHLNSRLIDLKTSLFGKLVYNIIIGQQRKVMGKESSVLDMERTIQDSPIRLIASFAGMSKEEANGICLIANGHPFKGYKLLKSGLEGINKK